MLTCYAAAAAVLARHILGALFATAAAVLGVCFCVDAALIAQVGTCTPSASSSHEHGMVELEGLALAPSYHDLVAVP